MQVDEATLGRYSKNAPELLKNVEDEAGLAVMKRDPATRQCVKLEGGWCGIHKQYGSSMLGDACHFYPRVTRALGADMQMTAAPSCPEIVRLMLELETPFANSDVEVERLPSMVKNYLPQGLGEAEAIAVHQAFLATAQDESLSASAALARISSVARSMALLAPDSWHQSVPLYLRLAEGRLPKPEGYHEDSFNLLHALCGLIVASHKPVSERLQKTISDIERSLSATLDWQSVLIHTAPESLTKANDMWLEFQSASAHYAHALKRYLQAQLSLALFPFAGLGENAEERTTFIGVRFATVKLALAAAHYQHGNLPQDDIIRIIQSLSRFLDHLGDGAFSLSIYRETGWVKEARLLSII